MIPSYLFSQSWVSLIRKSFNNYKSGNYDTAIVYCEKAIKKAEDEFGKKHENYAKSLTQLEIIYEALGRYAEAESLCFEASKIVKEIFGEKHISYAVIINNIALINYKTGNYFKAEQYFIDALKIFKEILTDNDPLYATLINNLAVLYNQIGNYSKSEKYQLESIKIRKETLGEKHPDYAISINNLALSYQETGNYQKAEILLKKSNQIIKENLGEKHPSYATSLNNLALLYVFTGFYDKAEALYKDVINIQKEVLGEQHPDYALSLTNLATLYITSKNYEKVEELLTKAMKIRENTIGEKHPDYAQTLNNLALYFMNTNDYKKAEPLIEKTCKIYKDIYGENHQNYTTSLNNLAALYLYMGQLDKIEPLLKKVLKIDKEILGEKHPNYGRDLSNLAILFEETNQMDKAELYFLKSNNNFLSQLETYYPFLSEIEKMKFLNTVYFNFEGFYSFALKRIKDNPKLLNDLIQLRIQTKGIILSSTSRIKNRIMGSGDLELIDLYKNFCNLHKEIAYAYNFSLQEQNQKGINLKSLEEKANEFEKKLSVKSENYKSEIEKRNITYRDIKNILKSNEATVEFLDFRYITKRWTDMIYYCAIISKPNEKNPIFINLCTLDSLNKIMYFLSVNKDAYIKNENENKELYNLIWKPLEEHLRGIEQVYISPTGILNKVSFASLKVDEQNLLIDKYKLRYVGNLKDIISIKESPKKSIELTASVFGGISYDIDSIILVNNSIRYKNEDMLELKPDASIILNRDEERSGWGYLKGTLTEAEKIKEILKNNSYEVKEYFNENGSEEALKSLSGKNSPAIIHISTHGFFYPEPEKKYKNFGITESKEVYKLSDNPLFRSGLILAGANRVWTGGNEIEGVENGILTAYEVSNMDLQNTELVVLSACETGLGDIKGGEGVYGLQRAFKVAGAKTIIMSLWKVPDKETVELMELFYINWLEKKMTKSEAFNSAQKEMRKKYEPYYWAAFVMVE